ncbi:MAG: DUF4215 domain-containing protein, partial [Sandaracinaceae bacterium]|nr:DUF4215 domain-containing protein [Sandaracinaceae bacterium]
MRSLRSGLFFLALLLPAAASADTIIAGGNIANQTWTVAGSPYIVQGDITIPSGGMLTIQPGVVVRFSTMDASMSGDPLTEMIVQGTLTVGGAGDPVTFESTALTGTNRWYGIRLETSSVSFSNAIVKNARHAIHVASGNPEVGDVTLRDSTFGLYVTGSASPTLTRAVVTLCATGVRMESSGIATVDHGTLYDNFDGAYVSAGTLSVTGSIVATNDDDGIERAVGTTVTVTHSNVWGNVDQNYAGGAGAGTGSFSANPLFVSASNLRLTSNSPSRFSDAGGTDQGALPYLSDATVGLVGTLWVDTTVAAGTTNVPGDLTVAPGRTLTLSPGATLVFAGGGDQMRAYEDVGASELRVLGRLVADGTTNTITLTSSTASATAWRGVHFYSTSAASSVRGVIVERARYAIHADGVAPSMLADLTLRDSTYGLYVTGAGSPTLARTVVTRCATGARMEGSGTATVDHCTLYDNFDGAYVSAGTLSVTGSIVATNDDDGIERAVGTTVTVTHSNVWGNVDQNYAGGAGAGTGSFSANPLFVSSSNLRLTSNSPSRFSDAGGTDQGALPYVSDLTVGLVGTLWVDTTVPAGTTMVPGDLTVAPGRTLTLAPGATLVFAGNSDLMRAYEDVGAAELRVQGSLSVDATSMPVTLTSTTASATAWRGVHFYSTSGASSVRGLTVERARYAIHADGVAPALLDALTLRSSTYGLYVTGAGSPQISNAVVTLCATGARMEGSGTARVVHSTLYDNFDGAYVSSGTLVVHNSIVATNDDDGIERAVGTTATVTYSDVWGNVDQNYAGGAGAGTGSISINPFFLGAPGDLRLSSTSPCIDAASATGALNRDHDGTTRPLDGDGINGAAYDMGAYEYAAVTVCGDGIVGAGESCDDGASNGMYGFCNSTCTGLGPRCGDGTRNGPEQCDDGNAIDTDACLSSCVNA